MKRSTNYIKKARQMEHIMKQQLETYRREVLLREFIGFEVCYNMFKDFYSDALKQEDNEQRND